MELLRWYLAQFLKLLQTRQCGMIQLEFYVYEDLDNALI